jgi:hypothetical protein
LEIETHFGEQISRAPRPSQRAGGRGEEKN